MDAILRTLTAGVHVKKQQHTPSSANAPLSHRQSSTAPRNGVVAHATSMHAKNAASQKRQRDYKEDDESQSDDSDSDRGARNGGGAEDDDDEEEEGNSGMAVFSRAAVGAQVSSARTTRPVKPGSSKESEAGRAARLAHEAQNALRNRLGIKVSGAGGPAPDLWQTFDAIPTSSTPGPVRDSLLPAVAIERGVSVLASGKIAGKHEWLRRQLLGIAEESEYKEPTGVQMQALPLCTAPVGREVVAIAPTGQGKTAAYTLPMLLRLQGGSRVGTGDGTWPGPRALILLPTKDLAVQVAREVKRLGADAAGLKVALLSRATVGGAAGHAVSAATVAPELLAGKKKKKGQGGRGGRGKRQRKDANAEDGGSASEEGEDSVQEEEEEEAEELDGPSVEGDEQGEDEALHWTDDEELEDKGGVGTGKSRVAQGKSMPPPPVGPPGPSPTHWAAPALPHCDILVSTPLLLLSALRSARQGAAQQGAAGEGVPVSSVGALFPRLAVCVLDECDRLLGGEDVRHKGSREGEASGFAAQVDEILLAARPGKAALEAWWTQHGFKLPAGKDEGELQSQPAQASTGSGAGVGGKAGKGKGKDKGAPPSIPTPAQAYAAHVASSLSLHLFTATLPGHVRQVLAHALRAPTLVQVGLAGAAAVNVAQKLLFVGREDGKLVALRDMLAKGVSTPALVFVSSQERCEQVAQVLKLAGQSAAVLHGGVGEGQREQAITRFRRGEVAWLVATDVASRGLDYPAVRYVLSVDFPTSAAAYVHRVGRTGRAGRQGEACTYFTEQDVPALRSVASVLRATGCDVPDWMLQLRKGSGAEKAAWVRGQGHRRPILKAKGGKPGGRARKG